MKRAVGFGVMTLALLAGGSAYAARQAWWRPVMPAFVIDVRTDAANPASALLLIYGERSSDPFRTGPLAADQRVSQCIARASLCVSRPARHEFRTDGAHAQSLQVRRFDGTGNPVIGGVAWTGRSYPRQVRLRCDLRVSDPAGACVVMSVTS